ncbi:hypothetical protein Droror1_Dr00021765 [Drosera rotundifolia]
MQAKILNLLRFSSWDSAKEEVDRMQLKWDSFTVNQVLKTQPPMEKSWLFFNWARLGWRGLNMMEEKGIKVDAITYTSMLHWFSNDGDIDGAVRMWEEMKEKGLYPTVVSYTAYMKILFDHKRVKEAIEVYKELLRSGCSPNCHTYTVLMAYLIDSG